MNIHFENLINEAFPSITEGTKEEIKESIRHININPRPLFQTIEKNKLYQGDIITNISFVTFTKRKKYRKELLKGMLISNTCDIENDNQILIAPVYSYTDYERIYLNNQSYLKNLKENEIYSEMYLPKYTTDFDMVVDFTGINSFESDFIYDNFFKKEVNKIITLSQIGYYLLLIKLGIYLFRRESVEVIREKHNIIN